MQLSCTEGVWKLRFKGISSQVGDRSSDRTVGGLAMPPRQEESWGHHFQSLGGLQSQRFSCLQSHRVHSTGPSSQAPPDNLGPSSLPRPEKRPTGASSELQRPWLVKRG